MILVNYWIVSNFVAIVVVVVDSYFVNSKFIKSNYPYVFVSMLS